MFGQSPKGQENQSELLFRLQQVSSCIHLHRIHDNTLIQKL